MNELKLVFPDYHHQNAMKESIQDLRECDQEPINGIGFYERFEDDFQLWIQAEKKSHLGIELAEDMVPGTTYLYMMGDEIVGSVNIRHCLNESLRNHGGHIGYSISPKYRRKGYATEMLKETLKICQQWEIWPILVTCDEDNVASRKTIEKCGGHFENKYKNTLRYWIGEKKDERF